MKPIAFKETQLQSDQDVIECGVDTQDLRHLFNLLVNAYSDPIGSTVREVVSNAFDATIELMKETGQDLETHLMNHPVDVNLTEDYFSVRDYGIGMDEERINKLYANLGRSSKRESNDYIGSFGIGRFSPLSYTDNFIVVTIKNGIKTTFQMVGKEIPVIVPMGTMETDEHSGTEIIISLKNGDTNKFSKAIRTQLRFMENIFYGGDVEYMNSAKIYKGKTFWLSSVPPDQDPYTGYYYYALIGRVAYPIDPTKVKALNSLHADMCIKLEIGTVAVTPNREQILYTDETVVVINAAIAAARQEIEEEARLQCDTTEDFKNYFEYLHFERPLQLGEFKLSINKLRIKITKLFKPFVDIGINVPIDPFCHYNFIDPENKSRVSYRKTKLTIDRLAETWTKNMKVYKPKADALGCRYYLQYAPPANKIVDFHKIAQLKLSLNDDFNKIEEIYEKFLEAMQKVFDEYCAGDYDSAEYEKEKKVKAVKKLVIHKHCSPLWGGNSWETLETNEQKLSQMPFPFVWIDFTTGAIDPMFRICTGIYKIPIYKLSLEAQKYKPSYALTPHEYVARFGRDVIRKFTEYKLARRITDTKNRIYWSWFKRIYPGRFVEKIEELLAYEAEYNMNIDLDMSTVRKSSILALNKLIRFMNKIGMDDILFGLHGDEQIEFYLEMRGIFGEDIQKKALDKLNNYKSADEWLT